MREREAAVATNTGMRRHYAPISWHHLGFRQPAVSVNGADIKCDEN